MLARIIQFALTQRLLIILSILVLIGAGWNAFRNTPIDAFPDVSTTQVKIIVKAPGMTPEEVETRITAPIEVEMLGIPRQSMLRSVAKYALTDITVDFDEGTDIYWARQQVSERLNAIWADLPSDITGGIAPMTTPLGEMFMFTIEGGDLDIMQRRELLDWVIRPALRTVAGVADVNALGGEVRTFEVVPDNARLTARSISLAQLREALELNNRNDGAGRLDDGEESLLVRTEGSIRTLDDVAASLSSPTRRSPCASVMWPMCRSAHLPATAPCPTTAAAKLSKAWCSACAVPTRVMWCWACAPSSMSWHPVCPRAWKSACSMTVATWSRVQSAPSPRRWPRPPCWCWCCWCCSSVTCAPRSTVALILPLSALATFILMNAFGLSANLMSLGGLAIAIGMLVDAAVVVVENVVTTLAHHGERAKLPRLHLIYRAAKEVAVPVTSGILDHRDRIPAAADPAGSGGQVVRPGRPDHRICPDRLAGAVAHRRSR